MAEETKSYQMWQRLDRALRGMPRAARLKAMVSMYYEMDVKRAFRYEHVSHSAWLALGRYAIAEKLVREWNPDGDAWNSPAYMAYMGWRETADGRVVNIEDGEERMMKK